MHISTVASYNLYNIKHVHIVFKTNEQQNKDLIYYTTRLHLTVLCTLNYYNLFHIIYVLTLRIIFILNELINRHK